MSNLSVFLTKQSLSDWIYKFYLYKTKWKYIKITPQNIYKLLVFWMIMIFEQNNSIERFGEKIGYIFSYFLFTTVLLFILKLLNKIPNSWSYFHIMITAFLITLLGVVIKRFLE